MTSSKESSVQQEAYNMKTTSIEVIISGIDNVGRQMNMK